MTNVGIDLGFFNNKLNFTLIIMSGKPAIY